MKEIILITGSSSGIGAMTARQLARMGHTVYASMIAPDGQDAAAASEARDFAAEHRADLRTVALDVTSQASVDAALRTILDQEGRLDVLVHNAGHMAFGPAEAFTPAQFAQLYEVNVVGAQRVNRAALPAMRARGGGLFVWVSSSSTRGGVPPYLAPYFAAKAAMDSLAVSYAGELARWGIETSIVVPGAFTVGTNHFAHADGPEDQARLAEWQDERSPYGAGFERELLRQLTATVPADADVAQVAQAISQIVAAPFGQRPFRVHIDPAQDGAEVVAVVADRIRTEFLRRIGFADLLTPAARAAV